jgi:hypothetical protein
MGASAIPCEIRYHIRYSSRGRALKRPSGQSVWGEIQADWSDLWRRLTKRCSIIGSGALADKQEKATAIVMEQAEALCRE